MNATNVRIGLLAAVRRGRAFLIPIGAVVALIVLASAVRSIGAIPTANSSPTPSVAPQHPANISSSEQSHASGGPYISKDDAIARAKAVGKDGRGTVVEAEFTSVGHAGAELGRAAASNYTGADREVWLVKIHGSYQPMSVPPGRQIPTYDHYFVIIDATTGQLLSTGSPADVTW